MGAGGEQVGRTPCGLPEDLKALIEEGYALFRTCRPAALGVCRDCCMDPAVEARILEWPVREIPLHDLRDWYFAASDNPFPRATIKWFLPRILELLASGEDLAAVGPEVLLHRLRYSGFPDEWPEAATEFMARYASAFLAAFVVDPEAFRRGNRLAFELDELLCMFGTGGVDLRPALGRLDALPTETLATAFGRNWALSGPDLEVDAFWESGEAKDLVFGWLTSDAMLDRMMVYGCGNDGPASAAALGVAEAIQRWREALEVDEAE